MDKDSVEAIIELFKDNYPESGTFLKYQNDYQFLVAVTLSARSTDEQVNRVSAPLFKNYPNALYLAEATPEEIAEIIQGCGLYRNKSRNLVKMARILVSEFEGKVPAEWDKLMALPGVGRKTANLVRATLFGFPAFPVDTHVYRVAQRLNFAQSEKVEKVEEELKQLIPSQEWLPLHHRFIFHGRKLCLSRNPRCEGCFVSHKCIYIHF